MIWSTRTVHAAPVNEGIFAETAVLAQTHNLHIIGSCLSRLGEEQYGNTLTWFDGDGRLVAHYNKIHLFQLMDEHKYLVAGNKLGVT